MKINLEINNLSQSPIENIAWEKIIEKVLEETADFLQKKEVSLSVAWVDEKEMKKLNSTYRQKDSTTDILSFPEFKNEKEIIQVEEKELFLGELILCYYDIERYVLEEKLDLSKELIKVFSHGLLHLLGFEHGDKMFSLQDKIAKLSFTK